MRSKLTSFLILLVIFSSCKDSTSIQEAKKDQQLTNYVNTFIGTGGHGHTYPGATLPYGMMQLSPDTRLNGWDGCSGYHYTDSYIYGFSHTHLSGTGISDYGDVLLMPTNEHNFNNGADGKKGYRAHFSHDNEIAEPGYYKVHLDSTNIDVELTVSLRSGLHKYQFPSSENQFVILDLVHRDKVLDAKIDKISDTEIVGYRHSQAWAKDQRLFFAIKTSHPFNDMLQSPPKTGMPGARRSSLKFVNPDNEPIIIKIGISAVDIDGARKNLDAEIGNKDFKTVKKEAQTYWESQLEKIVIESNDVDKKTNFYSALYHTMLAPQRYQDVDGRYRGMDLNIHNADFDYYSVFSLWDTYRAAHPLYTIIEQERTNDFINTFLAKYDEGGIMPMWDLAGNYTDCMIGYHAVPVVADAYLKGIRGYDTEKAFEAMKHSATRDKFGLEAYKSYGFIPVDEESESVSKTLEYAYDDWTIAQMAKDMGKSEDYKTYIQRAQYYKNVYDPETQFMRGRFRNTWFSPFDPYEVNFNYTEANSWQYSFYVPQDVSGFIKLLGGKDKLETQLDELFSAKTEISGRNQSDITGLIGQYAHGNEPSHHMAYLYNFVNKPHKTQEKVHQILTELYKNDPDGVSGNEDCGQMSAWYVLSSMGFYSVTPGSNTYIIGTPLFDKATVNLENGKTFTIVANNLSNTNIYIESATLNGKTLNQSFINHSDIVTGGILEFNMTDNPAIWGSKDGQEPKTEITEHIILPSPFIAKGDITFRESTEVVLGTSEENTKVYYALDNDDFKIYEKPFIITKDTKVKLYSEKENLKSPVLTTPFYKIDPNLSITLKSDFANQYSAGGNDALIDGIRSTKNYRTGSWQGYWDQDLVAIVDLGEIKPIYNFKVNFLRDQGAWIFLPREVDIYTSIDGKSFTKHITWKFKTTEKNQTIDIESVKLSKLGEARYVKVIAKKLGALPEWHIGYPLDGKSWIFVDEISIK
ncbi:GH92 family glycosyl hydrolase [Winogradskyella immobilis]|uniref:GH92 family glycosyl hydrolase n=1 Tax=Winogradskyella immobilis TaxID=2816852 RepID=A0ABS8EIV5_9FLAO|nr:GH92 family glycosyl hydrolase [Winogradskyella immobilis]MCC1482976.1 GH92 family glycosyl hydrolase [Winogradskyella immobilis]MCG0015071.1 GH92 family glycosyl hydrolase [Winogradskyella immobilis]